MNEQARKHLEAAKELIKNNDVINASIEATNAINADETCFEAYMIRGEISRSFGDVKGATEDMRNAIKYAPADVLKRLDGSYNNFK